MRTFSDQNLRLPALLRWTARSVLFLGGLTVFSASALSQSISAPTEVTFSSGKLTLHGFFYKPDGAGLFPAVLWNHGSERRPGWLPDVAPVLVNHGYILFIPHRRGQGRSPGDYVMDQLAQTGGNRAARSRMLVELMELHLQDQAAALAYLKNVPGVDRNRIAVAGCSFGGIQTVLMAEKGEGLRAAVDFAGGAESWEGSLDLRDRMKKAVRNAQVPIFFIQAKNDYDTSPSRELAAEMDKAHKPHTIQIFPAFGHSAPEAHEFCVHGAETWSAQVLSFFEEAFK